jgi:integrase
MPANALVCELCLTTGLRIDDVLDLRTKELSQVMTIHEQKTKKMRKVRISADLLKRLQEQAGKYFVFQHRDDERKHRTRQAVYVDLKRAARCFRLNINLSPHSIRKTYAVELLKKKGDLAAVQRALNHDNELVTMIYAFADVYTKQRLEKRGKKR